MTESYITNIIVDGNDYFVADTNLGVRLGMKGCCSLSVLFDDELYDMIKNVDDEDHAEEVFDYLVENGFMYI